jgi:hypothetical protein
MRIVLLSVLVTGLVASGCAHRRAEVPQTWEDPATLMANAPTPTADTNQPAVPAARSEQKLIVTPENSFAGKVATVNQTAGFVVLSFPPGQMPAVDQRLSLYRRGLKVGEVKVTGPQIDENVVADIIAGESDVGDEVK